MRMLAAILGILVALGVGAYSLRDGERPLTRASCAADMLWGVERFDELLAGARPAPYGPFDGAKAAEAFRAEGLPLPAENGLLGFTEFLRLPDACDFRWFAETNVFSTSPSEQGQLKLFVLATPELGAFEEQERARLARKYDYAHAMAVFRNGNVVVEYFFQLSDGSRVRRNRVEDVRRIVAGL